MGECDDFAGRVEFRGSYNSYECGLEISEAEAADDGEWSCDIESYVKSEKRGDGEMASKKFSVSVEIPEPEPVASLRTIALKGYKSLQPARSSWTSRTTKT